MTRDLSRLLRPKSIAVVGGGAWCAAVIEQCQNMGFQGEIWPVHPKAEELAGLPVFKDLAGLPSAPDAVFLGVNRFITVDLVGQLSAMNAGGAVCFASGFLEASAEDENAAGLQDKLLAAAGDMPILGPNCYGFINYLDGALLWPDQQGGQSADTGVAIVTQSSNIAINLTMQNRGLPIAYMITAGNQAQIGIAELGRGLLDDSRVTALGLHIEGFGDLRAWEELAAYAKSVNKPIVAIKVGKSAQAQAATVSHTASLAGGDAGAAALLKRLGIARLDDLASFLETLKLLHVTGPLPSNTIATMSCSGGEASLAADTAHGRDLVFPPLNDRQKTDLRDALGPMVALANPLDYHTYIWRDVPALTKTFAAMVDPQLAMTMLILDLPRTDRGDPEDWLETVKALIAAKEQTGGNFGLVATLPELLPEDLAQELTAAGIVAFSGLNEAMAACEAAAMSPSEERAPLLLPTPTVTPELVNEAEAKTALAGFGLRIPKAQQAPGKDALSAAIEAVGMPCVIKAEGLAHKSDVGGVYLARDTKEEAIAAAHAMPCETWLVEELVDGTIAELLVGVVKDPAHGFVLTLAAGGTLTELLQDGRSLLVPAGDAEITEALSELRIAKQLNGYRGAAPADMPSVLAAIRAVQDYVMANAEGLEEIEINPLLCTAETAVAVDALIRRKD
ncbi:acetate--CoA ligase family protein [Cognatishimia activa]|uniref:Acetate--CoA ligase family protein n=1 Tax=Cognatishimia activa TaxID=1715691 RepID=A0A975ERP0_9RHOB|nr:acetate--CoA ligase family protein [Cognatishimia activa]QTN36975.1 acetate--CoA ligase family protein [Cognatishimia activa]